MKKKVCLILFVAAAALALAPAGRAATMADPSVRTVVLAKVGEKSKSCKILLPDRASEAEEYAGAELATYLTRLTGSEPAVLNKRRATGVGWSIRLRHDSALDPESYRLYVDRLARELVIAGGRPRGVLYGVYGFLADHLGCRWYTPDVTYVPPKTNVAVRIDLDESVSPRLEYRSTDWGESRNADWAAHNRLNSVAPLLPRHGGAIVFKPFVHTFTAILNPAKEFAKHPEYFSMIDGQRIKRETQLCLSNPDVLKAAIEKAKLWARQGGGTNILSVSQNDWENPCDCPLCRAIDEEEGSHAGSLIRFVNKVAEAVEKEYPKASVETLAYLYSRKPPKLVKPRKNVIVRLCSIEACFAHPLDGCTNRSNVTFMDDLKGWNKLTNRLYVWDYTTDFNHYLMPFPNLDVLDKNMRTFVNNGVAGVFEEGNSSIGGELAELRSWVLAQLLWNPQLDGDALIREFVARVYGPASVKVQEFIDIQREAIRKSGQHVRIFDKPEGEYLNADVLRRCAAKLDEAEALALRSRDPALITRITRLRMPIWYSQYAMKQESEAVRKDDARKLIDFGKELKYTHAGAWTPYTNFVHELERFIGQP